MNILNVYIFTTMIRVKNKSHATKIVIVPPLVDYITFLIAV